jgi:hypothetical protein
MSQERRSTEMPNLANHSTMRKLVRHAQYPASWNSLIDEVSKSELMGQQVTVSLDDFYDMNREDDIKEYRQLFEDGVTPRQFRLDYRDDGLFDYIQRATFQGVVIEDGQLHYRIEWFDEDDDINEATVPVGEADIQFERDRFDAELIEAVAIINKDILSNKEKEAVIAIIAVLEGKVEDHFSSLRGELCDCIAKLDSTKYPISAQAALERILYIYCFSYGIDWEIGTKAFSKNSGGDRGQAWEYEEWYGDLYYAEGEIRGVLLETVEGRFIPYVYVQENSDRITRIALRDIEHTDMLP